MTSQFTCFKGFGGKNLLRLGLEAKPKQILVYMKGVRACFIDSTTRNAKALKMLVKQIPTSISKTVSDDF